MTQQLPILGYNMWWGLRGTKVSQETLEVAYA